MPLQIHNDDISNVLILNKKAVTNQEAQLFKSELEKFRPHQNRILQANHKQSSLMKELTKTYGELLQDKRVRSEQNKYEAFSRQRNTVLSKYRKVHQAYTDLQAGLSRAQQFYDEMRDTVDSLKQNVDSFVENRRMEGSQLLSAIEASKSSGADREQARMKELMERMSLSPSTQSSGSPALPGGIGDIRNPAHRPPPLQPVSSYSSGGAQQPVYNPAASPPITPRYNGMQSPAYGQQPPQSQQPQYATNGYHQQQQRPQSYNTAPQQQPDGRGSYNPNNYGPVSPPPHQQYFSPPPNQQYGQQPSTTQYGQPQQQQYGGQSVPSGWQPPPPPPGPPPQHDYGYQGGQYPAGPGGYASDPRRNQSQQQPATGGGDPWAGLSAWK